MRKTKLVNKPTFLLQVTNFFVGWGSAFNIPGNYYKPRQSKTGWEADKKAMESDWQMIGQDIKNIISKYPVNNSKSL